MKALLRFRFILLVYLFVYYYNNVFFLVGVVEVGGGGGGIWGHSRSPSDSNQPENENS